MRNLLSISLLGYFLLGILISWLVFLYCTSTYSHYMLHLYHQAVIVTVVIGAMFVGSLRVLRC